MLEFREKKMKNLYFKQLSFILLSNQWIKQTTACKQVFLAMFSYHKDMDLVEYVPKVIWGHY